MKVLSIIQIQSEFIEHLFCAKHNGSIKRSLRHRDRNLRDWEDAIIPQIMLRDKDENCPGVQVKSYRSADKGDTASAWEKKASWTRSQRLI